MLNKFDKVDIERKKELRRLAPILKEKVRKRFFSAGYSNKDILSRTIYEYTKITGKNLTAEEKEYFSYYILIPDDNYLFNLCQKYRRIPNYGKSKFVASNERYNFEKIAKYYNLPSEIVKKRYSIMLDSINNGIFTIEDIEDNKSEENKIKLFLI